MNPEQFAYWMQGFAELSVQPPNEEQWQVIRDHLALVFKKVTPDINIGHTHPAPAPSQTDLARLMDSIRQKDWPSNPYPHYPVVTC